MSATPGPWEIGYGDGITGPRVAPSSWFPDDGHVVHIPIRSGLNGVCWILYSLSPDESALQVTDVLLEDARLIAAAPALRDALAAIEALDDGDERFAWKHAALFDAARAALRKAGVE